MEFSWRENLGRNPIGWGRGSLTHVMIQKYKYTYINTNTQIHTRKDKHKCTNLGLNPIEWESDSLTHDKFWQFEKKISCSIAIRIRYTQTLKRSCENFCRIRKLILICFPNLQKKVLSTFLCSQLQMWILISSWQRPIFSPNRRYDYFAETFHRTATPRGDGCLTIKPNRLFTRHTKLMPKIFSKEIISSWS